MLNVRLRTMQRNLSILTWWYMKLPVMTRPMSESQIW